MNPKLIKYFSFLLISVLFGCKKESDLDIMQKKIGGKYSIISATSNQLIDINLDGVKTKDVLLEVPDLQSSYLELIIRDNSTSPVFSQFWMNQYFIGVEGKPIVYDPSISVNFMNQATVATFKVADDGKSLLLERSTDDPAFPLPSSVLVSPENLITILMTKEVFTTSGWKTVVIEVIYKRISPNV